MKIFVKEWLFEGKIIGIHKKMVVMVVIKKSSHRDFRSQWDVIKHFMKPEFWYYKEIIKCVTRAKIVLIFRLLLVSKVIKMKMSVLLYEHFSRYNQFYYVLCNFFSSHLTKKKTLCNYLWHIYRDRPVHTNNLFRGRCRRCRFDGSIWLCRVRTVTPVPLMSCKQRFFFCLDQIQRVTWVTSLLMCIPGGKIHLP